MDYANPTLSRVPLLPCVPIIAEHGTVSIRVGGQSFMLQGQDVSDVVNHVLPHINGLSTCDEVVFAVAATGAMTTSRAREILDALLKMGICVEDREASGDRDFRSHYLSQILYFGQHVANPTDCQKQLQASTVAVIGPEQLGRQLVQYLAEAGVGCLRAAGHADGELANRVRAQGCRTTYENIELSPEAVINWDRWLTDCDFAVLVLPQVRLELLKAFNEAAISQGIPFMPVCFDATDASIGPLVVPYETACLLCQYLRQNAYLTCDERKRFSPSAWTTMPAWQINSMPIHGPRRLPLSLPVTLS